MVTVQELRKEAAKRNIKGRSTMNKAQLCSALADVGVTFDDCTKGARQTKTGSPRKAGKKSPKKAGKKSPKKAGKKAGKKSPKKVAKKSPKKAGKKSPKKAGRKVAKKSPKVERKTVTTYFDELELEKMVDKSLKKFGKRYKKITGREFDLKGDKSSVLLSEEDRDNLEALNQFKEILTNTLRRLPEKKTEKLYFASYEYVEGNGVKFRYMSNYSLLGVKTSRGELAGKILLAMLEMIFSDDISEIMNFSDYDDYIKVKEEYKRGKEVLEYFSTYFDSWSAKLNEKVFKNVMFLQNGGERIEYTVETKREDTIILDEDEVVDLFWSKLEGDMMVE